MIIPGGWEITKLHYLHVRMFVAHLVTGEGPSTHRVEQVRYLVDSG